MGYRIPACIVCGQGTREMKTLGIATVPVHAACYEKMRADPDVQVLEGQTAEAQNADTDFWLECLNGVPEVRLQPGLEKLVIGFSQASIPNGLFRGSLEARGGELLKRSGPVGIPIYLDCGWRVDGSLDLSRPSRIIRRFTDAPVLEETSDNR